MKTKVIFALMLVAAIVVVPAPGADQLKPGANSWGGPNPFSIVGTWSFNAALKVVPPGFPASGKFAGTETFNSDGTMLVTSNIDGSTTGQGSWAQTGPLTYTFTFTFERLDPTTATTGYLLPTVVQENLRMTTPDSYITTSVLQPLDGNNNPLMICPPTGASICQFPGTVSATRYAFGSFNTVLP